MIPDRNMVMKYFKLKKKKCKILSKNVFSYNRNNIKKVFILENDLVTVFERNPFYLDSITSKKFFISGDNYESDDYEEIVHLRNENDKTLQY